MITKRGRNLKYVWLLLLIIANSRAGIAQHENMQMRDTTTASDTTATSPVVTLPGGLLANVPMERDGSGTSWILDASRMHAISATYDDWTTMLHGSVWLRYDGQDVGKAGSRGAARFDAPNWFMVMGSRPVGLNGSIALRGMFSLHRITEGGDGYPLLFQTGETWNGHRLVDQQHPHDLFMELSATPSLALDQHSTAYIYLAYPGEPALGPPTFMHRPSASHLADAPLGHHWQDATHISFGVATVGWRYDRMKLEASSFNGHEPDENRFNFDPLTLNSYSARLSVNPTRHFALQASSGYLRNPELLEPDVDVERTTASIAHVYSWEEQSQIATSAVWGMNDRIGHSVQHSFLLESELNLESNNLFLRVELVQKSAEALDLPGDPERTFTLNAFTFGVSKNVHEMNGVSLSIGVQGTAYGVVPDLQSRYGTHPFSLEVFVQLLPAVMSMEEPAMHEMEGM